MPAQSRKSSPPTRKPSPSRLNVEEVRLRVGPPQPPAHPPPPVLEPLEGDRLVDEVDGRRVLAAQGLARQRQPLHLRQAEAVDPYAREIAPPGPRVGRAGVVLL